MQDVSSAPVHRCPFCKSSSMRDNSVDDHAGLTALHASVQKVPAAFQLIIKFQIR
jgi:hypothetical protein